MTNEKPQTKIGAGHMQAMGRTGLAELRAVLYPESNIAQPAEYGLYGVPLPSEIAESHRTADGQPARAPQDARTPSSIRVDPNRSPVAESRARADYEMDRG